MPHKLTITIGTYFHKLCFCSAYNNGEGMSKRTILIARAIEKDSGVPCIKT